MVSGLYGVQSQFRFDNECYLNLPDNHKRVSTGGVFKPLTIYENPNVDMVRAIAAAAAEANALGDVTEDPERKHQYENLSNPEKKVTSATDDKNQLVATPTEDVILPSVSMLLILCFNLCYDFPYDFSPVARNF